MNKKAQHLSEMALIFTTVMMVLGGMQLYVKRGLNAKLKKGIDLGTELAQMAVADYKPIMSDEEDMASYDDSDEVLLQYETYQKQEITESKSKSASADAALNNWTGDDSGLNIHTTYSSSEMKKASRTGFDREVDNIW